MERLSPMYFYAFRLYKYSSSDNRVAIEMGHAANVVWDFPVQLLSGKFPILRRTERDMIKNVYRSSCKVPRYSCQILMKLEFSRQIFEKHSNIKFHENPSSASRVLPCGQTDRQKD